MQFKGHPRVGRQSEGLEILCNKRVKNRILGGIESDVQLKRTVGHWGEN